MKQVDSVLVVCSDKEPSARLSALLKDLRAKVTCVRSCEQARMALTGPENFQLVISDTRLADGNWYCVLSEIVELNSPAQLVVCSDRQDAGFRRRVRQHGALGLVGASDSGALRRLVASTSRSIDRGASAASMH